MNIFYVTMKSESTYKSMEYAQHSVEKYCNLGKYSNSLKRIVMESKDGVRVGAGRSYDDEKRPARFVYSLQWPLNETGGGN